MRGLSWLLAVIVMAGSTSLWAVDGVLPGSGTEGDPYLIEDLADFDAFADSVNAATYWASGVYTRLACDPNLAGRTYTTAVIAPDTSQSSGFNGTLFEGNFDGNGHVISNLTIDTAGADNDYLGLFGRIEEPNAEVRGLGIENINITGGDDSRYLGGLCGTSSGTITNCFSGGSVTGGKYCESLGGLCGADHGGIISNCYSGGVVTGGTRSRYLGGLCGYNGGDTTNCYATGSVTGGRYLGGLCGANGWNATTANCYATGSVTGGPYRGGLVGYSEEGTITNCFWDIETGGPDNGLGTPLPTEQMQALSTFVDAGWDFTDESANGTHQIWQMPIGGGYAVLSSFNGDTPVVLSGEGTEARPYLINDANELGAICRYDRNACFKLESDIDLIGITWTIAIVPVFSGCFDGDGHVVSNLTVDTAGASKDFLGLFGRIDGASAEVKKLGMENIDISGGDNSNNLGGICGVNEGGTITDCYAAGSVTGGDYSRNLGGVCGYKLGGTITNCYATGSVTAGDGSERLGGLCGGNYDGTITNCYATGSVTGGRYLGGLCGRSYAAITSCYATGSVTGGETSHVLGGLCGYSSIDGTISNCYATGSVTGGEGSSALGGLCGYKHPSGTIAKCFWDIETGGPDNGLGTPLPTAEMQTLSTFTNADWDFINVWNIGENQTYPYIRTYSAGDINKDRAVNVIDLSIMAGQWMGE